MQMGRTNKPQQPAEVERFDISEGDHLPPEPAEPPVVRFQLGKKFAKSLAQHMSKHKRSSRATSSTTPAPPFSKQLEDEARVADDKAYKSATKAVRKVQKEKRQTVAKPKKTRPTTEQQIVSLV